MTSAEQYEQAHETLVTAEHRLGVIEGKPAAATRLGNAFRRVREWAARADAHDAAAEYESAQLHHLLTTSENPIVPPVD